MSDTADDLETAGRRILDEAKTSGLRERMRNHLATHESPDEFKAFRRTVASGTPLSEAVDENRDERV